MGRLHVIVNAPACEDAIHIAQRALEGGAAVIQVRGKGLGDRDLYSLAHTINAMCRRLDRICIINDRLDIALAVGANGVHLGNDDLPVDAARHAAGSRFLIGGTARDPECARGLEASGVDYIGVGPVWATITKENLPTPIGVQRVAEVATAVSIPVIAIGGITAARAPEVLAAGARGVAVVSAVSNASDPRRATEGLRDVLGEVPWPIATM